MKVRTRMSRTSSTDRKVRPPRALECLHGQVLDGIETQLLQGASASAVARVLRDYGYDIGDSTIKDFRKRLKEAGA